MVAKGEPCAYAKLSGKLGGEPFNCYMMELPTTLGRASAATEGDKKPAGFIDLGKSKALSREHATIQWARAERKYKITCLGKNGMVVGGKYKSKGGVETLGSRTPIKLGPAHLYFLLPEAETKVRDRNKMATSTSAAAAVATGLAVEKATGIPGASVPEPSGKEQKAPPKQPQQVPPPPAGTLKPKAVAAAVTVSFNDMVVEAFKSAELSSTAVAGGLSSGDVQNWIMQKYPEWNEEGPKMKTLARSIEGVLRESFSSRGEDRWAESSLPSAKRARTSSEPLSNVAHATTNSTTTTPPKPANNADDNVEAPTAAAMAKPITEVVSAPSSTTVESGGAGTGGGGGEDDGGGIDVGMES